MEKCGYEYCRILETISENIGIGLEFKPKIEIGKKVHMVIIKTPLILQLIMQHCIKILPLFKLGTKGKS